MRTEYFVIISLVLIAYIVHSVKKRQLSIEESLFWIIGAIIALFLSVFPNTFDSMAKIFGISYPPALFFLLAIIFLTFNSFKNSMKIAKQQEKIIDLAQEIAILKEKTNEKN